MSLYQSILDKLPKGVANFVSDLFLSLRAAVDGRLWVLLILAYLATFNDPILRVALWQNLSVMIWIAVISHILRVIILTSNQSSPFTKKALESPVASAILIAADRFVLAVILLCTTYWLVQFGSVKVVG